MNDDEIRKRIRVGVTHEIIVEEKLHQLNFTPETIEKMYSNQFNLRFKEKEFYYSMSANIVGAVAVDAQHMITKWCEENCSGLFFFNRGDSRIYFTNDEDAAGFRLTWG